MPDAGRLANVDNGPESAARSLFWGTAACATAPALGTLPLAFENGCLDAKPQACEVS